MKKFFAWVGLASMAIITVFMLSHVAYASTPDPVPTPVTIQGTLTDEHGHAVAGRAIVVWCGDISHFGGQASSDAAGHFMLQTDSEKCPLGWLLSAVAYNLTDPAAIDGLSLATVHTQTTVNVQLGVTNTVPVSEYGPFGAVAAVTVGGIAILAARRLRS